MSVEATPIIPDVPEDEVAETTTISFYPPTGLPVDSLTLTSLTREDTDTDLALPDDLDFVYDADGDVWTLEAELPAGIKVWVRADGFYESGGPLVAQWDVTGDGSTAFFLFGTRGGMEQKCNGATNLAIYEFQPAAGVTRDSSEGQQQIGASILDDLEEANADMAVAWREFTDIPLGYSSAYEHRWLNDTAEFGAVVKAWAGRNISRATSEDVPQHIATAMAEWERRLQMLRDGTALKDYYEAESDEADSGILDLQAGLAPVAKLPCPSSCCSVLSVDSYDCEVEI